MEQSKQLDLLMDWVTSRLALSDVPRFSDVINHAHREMGFRNLKRAAIVRRLRLHPAYLMNSQQQKATVPRSNNFRPILANHLGVLHADIGYFPKGAERAIGQIRTIKDRLEQAAGKKLAWWKVLQTCVDNINSHEIIVNGVGLGYAPRDINQTNLEDYLERLYKADKATYFNQFELAPDLVKFKYPVGTFVRPKLIVTSSAVLGVKRSQVTLEDTVYGIVRQVPYNTRGHFVGKAYECENLQNPKRDTEIFDERDIVETIAV